MKHTLKTLALTIVLLLGCVSVSHAEWTKLVTNERGTIFYLDFERIRKHDGYVYYWDLTDYLKPTESNNLSTKIYNQGDCKLFRRRGLSYFHYKQPMGRGSSDSEYDYSPKDPEWRYPIPDSIDEFILKTVCSR